MSTRIQIRRGTAAEGSAQDPILAAGEIGYETDTGKAKIGDGATRWSDLRYSILPRSADGTIPDAQLPSTIARTDRVVPAQDTAPDPDDNPLWVDTSLDPPVLKSWDGAVWIDLTARAIQDYLLVFGD